MQSRRLTILLGISVAGSSGGLLLHHRTCPATNSQAPSSISSHLRCARHLSVQLRSIPSRPPPEPVAVAHSRSRTGTAMHATLSNARKNKQYEHTHYTSTCEYRRAKSQLMGNGGERGGGHVLAPGFGAKLNVSQSSPTFSVAPRRPAAEEVHREAVFRERHQHAGQPHHLRHRRHLPSHVPHLLLHGAPGEAPA